MYSLQVEGMSCSHCVAAVTRSVREVDAQARVEVDLGAGRVAIDSSADPALIKAAIADAGYTVKGGDV